MRSILPGAILLATLILAATTAEARDKTPTRPGDRKSVV